MCLIFVSMFVCVCVCLFVLRLRWKHENTLLRLKLNPKACYMVYCTNCYKPLLFLYRIQIMEVAADPDHVELSKKTTDGDVKEETNKLANEKMNEKVDPEKDADETLESLGDVLKPILMVRVENVLHQPYKMTQEIKVKN